MQAVNSGQSGSPSAPHWLAAGSRLAVAGATSAWWHGSRSRGPVWPRQLRLPTVMHPAGRGQGLSPAVSTPIGFHGSSLICRICHWRAGLLLGGFKPCCHGSQDPPPHHSSHGSSALSLSFSFFSQPTLFLLYHSVVILAACRRSPALLSPQFVCMWVRDLRRSGPLQVCRR